MYPRQHTHSPALNAIGLISMMLLIISMLVRNISLFLKRLVWTDLTMLPASWENYRWML